MLGLVERNQEQAPLAFAPAEEAGIWRFQMKTIRWIATVLVIIIGFVGEAAAQTTFGPLNDAAAAQLYVDRQLTASATQCVTNVYACGGAPCPSATLGQCSDTIKAAKACPNCATKKWVMDKLRGILAQNQADLAKLKAECEAKDAEQDAAIAALQANDRLQDAKLAEHDDDIAALKAKDAVQDGRLDKLEKKDEEQDAAIADVEDSQLHLELSGFGDFAFSGNVSVLGAMAGVALGIADNVDATVAAGLGGSLDGELAISIRAGVMLRPAKGARGFSLGFLGFGTFEGLEDDGDRELGGLALLRYTFGKDPVDSGFFIEAFAGLAYESVMVPVAQPLGSPIRETTRKGGAAGNAGFALGYRF
jgi:hypothetical protein